MYILPPDWMAERWTGTRIKPNEAVLSWRGQAKRIARQVGQALVEEAGPSALVGRCEKIKKGNKEIKLYHAAPKAFNHFLWELKKIYEEKGGNKV